MNPRLQLLAAMLPFSISHALAQSNLGPVLVTATRQEMRTSELLSDVTVIDRQELEAAGHSTLEEVLARQPGVEYGANGSFGSSSSLYVRGGSASHVLLLVDGMRVGSATLGSVSWSRIPVSQIERIEIVRGPASSLYGSDAIGGVVQVFTRQGDGPLSFQGEVGGGSYGTASANGGISGAQDGWRYALNASTYSTAGFNSKPWTPTANKDRDGFWDNSLSGRLSYAIAKGQEAGISFLHSDGENRYDGSGATNDWRNQLRVDSFNTFLKNAITDTWTSTLNIGKSTDDSKDLNNGSLSSAFRTDQTLYVWQNDFRSSFGNFLLGYERLEQKVDTSAKYTVNERTNDSLLAGWNIGFDAHRLQLNLRRDDNSQFGEKTTGSAAYGYRFNQNWRSSFSYGTAFKAPTFNDLYYPLDSWGYHGNPNLQPESAKNREVALHYELGRQHVSMTWYLNRVENLIVWTTTPGNVGSARLEGMILAYEGTAAGLDLKANLNLQDAKDEDTGQRLARRARHFGNVSAGQSLGAWEWRVEQYMSDSRIDYPYGMPPKKLAGYALTNLYGAYRLSTDWSLFARINNLFDREYVLADGYATPGVNAFLGVRYSPK